MTPSTVVHFELYCFEVLSDIRFGELAMGWNPISILKNGWRGLKRAGKPVAGAAGRAVKWVADTAKRTRELILHGAKQAAAFVGAPVLAAWIVASRNATKNAGVDPIPNNIRRRLEGPFSAELLDKVRYRVGRGPWLALPRLGFAFGRARAMALDNVVAFKGQEGASDVWLWAHECVHVRQYQDWGVMKFAFRYLDRRSQVEAEANDFANQYF